MSRNGSGCVVRYWSRRTSIGSTRAARTAGIAHATAHTAASSPATSANVSGSAGDFMRHPKGDPHYDGALNEDTWVAISGYGPANVTVIDGGELFGRSR